MAFCSAAEFSATFSPVLDRKEQNDPEGEKSKTPSPGTKAAKALEALQNQVACVLSPSTQQW